jgi:hypothetical protein
MSMVAKKSSTAHALDFPHRLHLNWMYSWRQGPLRILPFPHGYWFKHYLLLSCTGKVFGCIDVLHSFHVVFFFKSGSLAFNVTLYKIYNMLCLHAQYMVLTSLVFLAFFPFCSVFLSCPFVFRTRRLHRVVLKMASTYETV